MTRVRLPVFTLPVDQQQYSCHGCGNCCRDFTVQLREEDIEKLREQQWEEKLGEPVTVDFRGETFLRQREDGSCIFLMENGLCRIHAEHGFEEKPIACQLFPFHLSPNENGVSMGLNFACQSVLENKGAELKSHIDELRRMAGELPEAQPSEGPPSLTKGLRAESEEIKTVQRRIDEWMRQTQIPLSIRLDGLAWITCSLAAADFTSVRGKRFRDLLDLLFGALPDELALVETESASTRQMKMLRQAVFSRTEDPKLTEIEKHSRMRFVLSQFLRSRRFAKGRGVVPVIGEGWPSEVGFSDVEIVQPASDDDDIAAIDDLLTRYVRATVLGGRCWGSGYYGWPVVSGLAALSLNLSVIGWLARLHAAGRGRDTIDPEAVRAAVSRVDRTSGRARWLGSTGERLRLRFLVREHGLRSLLNSYSIT